MWKRLVQFTTPGTLTEKYYQCRQCVINTPSTTSDSVMQNKSRGRSLRTQSVTAMPTESPKTKVTFSKVKVLIEEGK